MSSSLKLVFILIIQFLLNDFLYAQNEKLGEGFFRVSFINKLDCQAELQSFNKEFNEDKLVQVLPILVKVGGKNQGLSHEFKTYSVIDFSRNFKDENELMRYGEVQLKNFEETIQKLMKHKVPIEYDTMKSIILKHYKRKINFEKIMLKWINAKNDVQFKQEMSAFNKDPNVVLTIDKLTNIKSNIERIRFMYFELFTLCSSTLFPENEILEIQLINFEKTNLKIVVDTNCEE